MSLVIILVILLSLFALAFMTRRRFGVLGLGLAAGTVLAQSARPFVSDFYAVNRVPVEPLGVDSAALITLILLPALLLLISGPVYVSKRNAFLGALGFALLGTLLILGPITTALPLDTSGAGQMVKTIAQYQKPIVAVAIGIAVLDTILLHNTKPRSRKPKH